MTGEPKRRGPGRPKGTPASDAQKATSAQARKVAAAKKAERKAARQKELELAEKPRWKKLEDGDLSVRDLHMDELVRLEIANNDGSWEGRRRTLSSRLVSRMETERVRRLKRDMAKLAPAALEALEDLLDDTDNPNVRFQTAKHVLEHNIGKPAEIIHIGSETEWDRLQQGAFVIVRGEEAVTGGDEDIVDAEVVEES